MPRIQRQDLPRALFQHLLDRVQSRLEPEVPVGKWFKRFAGFTVCGEGMLIKTFLQAGQLPLGTELDSKK